MPEEPSFPREESEWSLSRKMRKYFQLQIPSKVLHTAKSDEFGRAVIARSAKKASLGYMLRGLPRQFNSYRASYSKVWHLMQLLTLLLI